jgi:hypothetical protein
MTSPRLDTSYFARAHARHMQDPEYAAAYNTARAEIDVFDARVRAAIDDGRLPADWENWTESELALSRRIGAGEAIDA